MFIHICAFPFRLYFAAKNSPQHAGDDKTTAPKATTRTKSYPAASIERKMGPACGDRPEVDASVEQFIAAQTMDWSRLGYVQMARQHEELCSAVMLLSDLHKMKSPAKRLLLFPKSWLKKAVDAEHSAEMATTRRLLRTAARRYGVSLIPIEPIVDEGDGEYEWPLQDQQLTVRCKTYHHQRTR